VNQSDKEHSTELRDEQSSGTDHEFLIYMEGKRSGRAELAAENSQLRSQRDELVKALELIEMETRDGAQWNFRDINEYVLLELAKLKEAGS
jgi:hypothetical protein